MAAAANLSVVEGIRPDNGLPTAEPEAADIPTPEDLEDFEDRMISGADLKFWIQISPSYEIRDGCSYIAITSRFGAPQASGSSTSASV